MSDHGKRTVDVPSSSVADDLLGHYQGALIRIPMAALSLLVSGSSQIATALAAGLQKANNLSDLPDVAAARTNLGVLASDALDDLGTAADEDVGAGAGNVVQLDAAGRYPALDGSQIINVGGWNYDSGFVALASSAGTQLFPHGLPSTPSEFIVHIQCVTAEHGYAIGDVVQVHADPGSGTNNHGAFADGVNIGLITEGSSLNITNKANGGADSITSNRWVIRVRARP